MDTSHNLNVSPNRSTTAVVIAASAGGLTAIEELLENLTPSKNACFFVLLHLANDKDSALVKRLALKTSMSVHTMSDGFLTQPNSVYVLPPGHLARLVNGELLLSEAPDSVRAHPIDVFCGSLAEQRDTNACAVFLSGVGEDGCLGAAKMHASGKEVIAQAPDTARFPSLPSRVIELCGSVTAVLPPGEIGQWLGKRISDSPERQLACEPVQHTIAPQSNEQHVLRGINAELHQRIAFLEERISYLQSIKSSRVANSSPIRGLQPLSVLIVDNDPNDRAFIRALLDEIAGTQYEVAEAPGAGEAMQMLTANTYDLCLLDYRLDDITASGLLDSLPESTAQTSFVVISGLLDLVNADNQLSSGAVTALDKNHLTADALSDSIQSALQLHRSHAVPMAARLS